MTPLVAVNNLIKDFPARGGLFRGGAGVRAVDDVSFTIAPGETFGLVGESGCGKSMTALSLMRLVPPPGRVTGGRIRLDGRELTALPEREMRAIRGAKLAMIFQEPMTSLNPVFTVGSQIAEAIRLHTDVGRRAAWDRAVELLALDDDRARSDPRRPDRQAGIGQSLLHRGASGFQIAGPPIGHPPGAQGPRAVRVHGEILLCRAGFPSRSAWGEGKHSTIREAYLALSFSNTSSAKTSGASPKPSR